MQVFSVHKKVIFQEMDTVSTDLLSLLLFRSNPMHENNLSACVLVPGTHKYFLASLANVGYSSFLAFHQSRKFLSAPKGSFRYLLQQLRNSFANVKISKLGELIHLALSLSITFIVRFIDVKQSSFRLWSINLVSGNILLPFQQVQLSSQLAPAPLPAALVFHL